MPDGVRPPTTGTGFLYDRRDLMQETDGFGGGVDLMYAGATDEIYGDLISEGDGDGLIHFYDAMGSTVALADGSSGDWHAKRNHRQVNVWKVVSRPSKIPPATRTGSHMATRADLIKLVELVRREPVGSPRRRELFEQLHAGLGLDIERLEIMVGQEGEAEWTWPR